MKPIKIFGFFLILFILLGLISLIYPKDGIKITDDFSLDYPQFQSLYAIDTATAQDFTAIIEEDFDIDSLELEESRKKDSIMQVIIQDSIRYWQLKLHYPNNDKSVLYPLFKSLDDAASKGPIRIMHYGDSQIEGDRITGYLRHKLQNKFGGYGPGLLPAVPLVRSAAINHSASENWQRYTMYGKVDSLVTHSKYGPLATFGRFTPIYQALDSMRLDSLSMPTTADQDSSVTDSTTTKAKLTFAKSTISYNRTKIFNRFDLLFGNFQTPIRVTVLENDSLLSEQTFTPKEGISSYKGRLHSNAESVTFEFEGMDSPDVYGVSLEAGKGVIVDNIAMRGSSGTLFRRMNKSFLQEAFNKFPIKLLILQFGGNVMPYIEDEKECIQYGVWFESQLVRLKELIPGVSIIVIGPADMGTFVKGEYTSYPLLPNVRDALKKATFAEGGVYWDMMEAMGGENSMKAWVEANPSLASSDYVHFNLRGASKVAQLFYNALIEDYNEYKGETHGN